MRKKFITGWALLLLLTFHGYGQSRKEKQQEKASDYYNSFSYVKAKELYKELAKDTTNHVATEKLAECAYMLNQWNESEQLLSRVVAYTDANPRYYLMYAHALKSNGKWKESDEWMEKFHSKEMGDSRGISYSKKENSWDRILADKTPYSISLADFNSAEADFSPCYNKNNQLIFVSARGNSKQIIPSYYSWNERPFLDLFVADISGKKRSGKISLLPGVNTNLHDGPVCFDSSFSVMYVTRNSTQTKNKQAAKGKLNHLKLYSYKYTNNEWGMMKLLPFNSEDYSVGHACLSPDQKRLYFVSDKPGGKGGADIYYVEIKQDGAYGPVTNAGSAINTEGNEMFPFIDRNGTLFFASDGHPGLGRLDIFYSKNQDGRYTSVVNAGNIINSSQDDFGIVFSKQGSEGFFSSNRPGGKGDDDIYHFTVSNPGSPAPELYTLTGVIKDQEKNLPVENAEIMIYDTIGNFVSSVRTDKNGEYVYKTVLNKIQKVEVRAAGYSSKQRMIDENALNNQQRIAEYSFVLGKEAGNFVVLNLNDKYGHTNLPLAEVKCVDLQTGDSQLLSVGERGEAKFVLPGNYSEDTKVRIQITAEGYFSKIVTLNPSADKGQSVRVDVSLPEVGLDVGKEIEMNPIYFDLGKTEIRPDAAEELDKIVEVLKQFPQMIIELGSHTDSRGSDAANLILSEQRAKACMNYILSKGITIDRIQAKGYGELKLLNHCQNNVHCSEKEHEVNRRIEFVIKKF